MKYLHVSMPVGGTKGEGVTFNAGRNAHKRDRRLLWAQQRAAQVKRNNGIISRKRKMLP